METFGFDLSEKDVIRSDGSEVGTMHNVNIDPESGRILNLVIVPNKHHKNNQYPVDDNGYYRVPADEVKAVDDTVVLN